MQIENNPHDGITCVMVDMRILVILVISIAGILIFVAAYNAIAVSIPIDPKLNSSNSLPVLLVHGLALDSSVWKEWEYLLGRDGIKFYSITFQKSDDKCGDAVGHASEIGEIVQLVKRETGSERVNIVGHSKGGIDARVYLANGTTDVANLVMIGTPNQGTPLAEFTSACSPAISDVLPGANATKAKMNPNTNYWTIAGDWQHEIEGNPVLQGIDDGQVQVSSVESEEYFQSLGRTENHHLELLGEPEYKLARNVIVGRP